MSNKLSSEEKQKMSVTSHRQSFVCLNAIAAAIIVMAYSPAATAEQPECPCWEGGAFGLAADVTDVSDQLVICDTHPRTSGASTQALIQTHILSTHWIATTTHPRDRRGPGPVHGRAEERGDRAPDKSWCSTEGFNGYIDDVQPGDLWACIRDIGTVCRALGF